MDQPFFLHYPDIHIPVEDRTRLYEMICKTLNVPHLRSELVMDCARAAARGLSQLCSTSAHAAEWHARFADLSECDAEFLQPKELGKRAEQNPLADLLARQPAAHLPTRQQAACEQIAALALVEMVVHPGRAFPKVFWKGLGGLYLSGTSAWSEIRKHLLANGKFSDEFLSEQPKGVRLTFVRVTNELLMRVIPDAHILFKTNQRAPFQPGRSIEEPVVCVDPPVARPQSTPDVSPNFSLFELIRRDDDFAPALNGFRVGCDWDAMHPSELQPLLQKLGAIIRDEAPENTQRRLAGCAAIVALFTRASFGRCFQLPLIRRGSIHLDLPCRMLRRELEVLAQRSDDEQGARSNGFWLRTPLPEDVCEILLGAHEKCASAKSLGQLLASYGVSEGTCFDLVNEESAFVHHPASARFAKSMSGAMLALGIHPSVTFVVTGDTTIVPSSEMYYLARSQSEIHEAVGKFCDWGGLVRPKQLFQDRLIGSPKVPSKAELRTAFEELGKAVIRERMKITPRSTAAARNQFFNFYVTAVLLQTLWSVGARFARLETLTFNRIFAIDDAALLSDKQTDSYSEIRCVPISQQVRQSLCHYLEHVRAHADWLKRNGEKECAMRLAAISNGQRQTLSAFELLVDGPGGKLTTRTIELSDIKKIAEQIWPGALNRARHFFTNEFVSKGVPQPVIDAFTGRYCRGAEPFGLASAMSVLDYLGYLRPIIDEIHTELCVKPIVGFGRTAARYLSPPKASVRPGLEPLENQFLNQKLAEAELLIPEVRHPADECPFSSDSLLALAQVRTLRKAYLRSAAPARLRHGAVLFTLTFFDGVASPEELKQFYEEIVGGGACDIGKVALVALKKSGKVITQRVLSAHSVGAAKKIMQQEDRPTFAAATIELQQLLSQLDAGWQKKQNAKVLHLLTALMSHALAFEVPQHLQVALHHKAPLLRAEDLARIRQQLPCIDEAESVTKSYEFKFRSESFDVVMPILRRWADKENRVGEQQARRAGIRRELAQLISSGSLCEAETLIAEWVVSECADRPLGRRLRVGVLVRYVTFALPVFHKIALEETINLDAEVWRELLDELERGQPNRRDRARWVLTHVCNFLSSRGATVPQGLLTRRQTEPRVPRNLIYVTTREVEQVCQLSKNGLEFHASDAGILSYKIARVMPLRTCEVNFAKLNHVSARGDLLAVTSSGHGHLKYDSSRGLMQIPKELRSEVLEHVARRSSLGEHADVPLFAGSAKVTNDFFRNDITAVVAMFAPLQY